MQKIISKLFFSRAIANKSAGRKVALIALWTAFSAITNTFLEVKAFDLQFSLTITVSVLAGVFLGPVCGFAACFLGDLTGYLVNSWGQLYFFWVGLATGLSAFISGVVFNFFTPRKKSGVFASVALVCALHFVFCTVAVNSSGFYLYNRATGFLQAFLDYIAANFGGSSDFFAYLCYRLFFKGQIFNSVANYALLFAVIPALSLNSELRKYLQSDERDNEGDLN